MGQNFNKIIAKINELVELRLNKGISPSELMENISSDDYIEINAKKIINGVQCTVILYDESFFDNTKVKYKYIYEYNNEMVLIEIRLLNNNTKSIVWNRQNEEKKIFDEIMQYYNNDSRYKKEFVKSLPEDLYDLLNENGFKLSIG